MARVAKKTTKKKTTKKTTRVPTTLVGYIAQLGRAAWEPGRAVTVDRGWSGSEDITVTEAAYANGDLEYNVGDYWAGTRLTKTQLDDYIAELRAIEPEREVKAVTGDTWGVTPDEWQAGDPLQVLRLPKIAEGFYDGVLTSDGTLRFGCQSHDIDEWFTPGTSTYDTYVQTRLEFHSSSSSVAPAVGYFFARGEAGLRAIHGALNAKLAEGRALAAKTAKKKTKKAKKRTTRRR